MSEARERAEREAAERARIERDGDLAGVMSTQNGRRFVWRIIDDLAGALNGSFVGDPLHTAFNEGKRAVGLALTQEVQRVAGEAYVHMLGEQLAARRREAAEREEREADDG